MSKHLIARFVDHKRLQSMEQIGAEIELDAFGISTRILILDYGRVKRTTVYTEASLYNIEESV